MTPRQLQALRYIRDHTASAGCPPTFAEIVDALDLKPKSAVARIASELREQGCIVTRFNRSRSFELTPKGEAWADGAGVQSRLETASDAELVAEIKRRGWSFTAMATAA
jgi:SOS-response transcriptional repressor LexA